MPWRDLFCLSSSQELRSACLFIPIYFRSSLRKIYSFLGYKEDQGRMDCVYHYSTGKFSFKCQISAAVQYINKTKYFRLRLYYKLSKRAYRDLRQFWDRNMRESWRFSALRQTCAGRTDRHCDTLSSWRGQKFSCQIIILIGSFKRSHKSGENPFTHEQRNIVKFAIHQLNRILIKSQKETLPLDLYEFYNDS